MKTTDQFLADLRQRFALDGAIGHEVQFLINAESEYAIEPLMKFSGFQDYAESFFVLVIRTLQHAEKALEQDGWPQTRKYYSIHLIQIVTALKYFRASHKVAFNGYPVIAYGFLRDLLDRAMLFRACLDSDERYQLLFLTPPNTAYDAPINRKLLEKRRKEEKTILSEVIGANSGFGELDQKWLRLWRNMFHDEVHGGKYSAAFDQHDWASGKSGLNIAPVWNEAAFVLFMNRFTELSWIWIRLLTVLQSRPAHFGIEWAADWTVLDESAELQLSIDKQIFIAVINFVRTKFPYSPSANFKI